MKLTARNVPTLRAGTGRLEYWDKSLPGFYLRVTPNGIRTYGVWYRVRGRAHRLSLGRHSVVDLASARERARQILAAAVRGEDLGTDRRASDLETLTGRFLEASEPNLREKTLTEYRRILAAEIETSAIARMPIKDLRRGDLKEFLEKVARRAPVMGNRVYQLVRAVMRWGVREELIGTDPTEGLQRPRKERSRERVLRDDEIVTLWHALEAEDAQLAGALRLLLLLGQRRAETILMRWTDLDVDAGTWKIPGKFRKSDRAHVVPLSPSTLRILENLRPLTGMQERVFPGVSLQNPNRWFAPLRRRAMKAGVEHFTLHDLRRTCATGMGRLGTSRFIVGCVVGHAEPGGSQVTGIYDRFDRLPEKAAALNAWAVHVERITSGRRGKADVVPLTR